MADQNQNRKQYTKQGYQELLDELRRRQQEEREKIREDIAVAKLSFMVAQDACLNKLA